MKWRPFRCILVCIVLLSSWVASGKDYLSLTNPEGKEIVAAIIDVHRDWVTIELKASGQEMRTELSRFSSASQQLIQAWQEEQAIAKGLEFGISSKTFESDKGSSASRTWKTSQEGYSIRVANSADVGVTGITAKYLIVVKRERLGRSEANDHHLEEIVGHLNIPSVPSRETVKIETRAVTLREEALNAGYFLTGGGMEEAENELEGIIVEFYRDDKLIDVQARPSSLAKNHSIQTATQKMGKNARR